LTLYDENSYNIQVPYQSCDHSDIQATGKALNQ